MQHPSRNNKAHAVVGKNTAGYVAPTLLLCKLESEEDVSVYNP